MTEPRTHRPRLASALVLSVVLAALGCLLGSDPETNLVRGSYDSLHLLSDLSGRAVEDGRVVIVYLDPQSYRSARHDPAKPWPRELHSRLVDRLTQSKARAVVFDILFADPGPDAVSDEKLAAAIRRNGRVILAADRNSDSTRQPSGAQDWLRLTTIHLPDAPLLAASAGWGFADHKVDGDFTVRRSFSGIVADHQPSLGWALAQMQRLPGAADESAMREWNEGWMRYYGPPLTLPHVSYWDAIQSDGVPDEFFRDKIVLIGARPMTESFLARHDEFRSPFGSVPSRYAFMPGVEVHGTQILNLLRNDGLKRLAERTETVFLVVAAFTAGFGFLCLRPIAATIAAVIGLLLVAGLATWSFGGGVWFPWLIVGVVQIPGALGGSVLFHSVEWYRTRRRLEAARRVAEARIREQAALIEKAHDAILVQDLDGRVRYANPSAKALFGWKDDDWQRPGAIASLFASDAAAIDLARQRALSDGEWNGELKLQSATGRVVIVSSRWTLIRDEAGQSKELLLISSDITDQKQLEAQFLRTQRMETIGSLAGSMAHDLNNALSPILMGVQMLRRRGGDEESARILGLIESSTHRGAQMVRQVLHFARGREGETERLAIGPLVCEMEKIVRDSFPKGIEVEAFLPVDLWSVRGNPIQLHQVLLNLCVNARDAMPDGGRITFVADNVVLGPDDLGNFPEARPGDFVSITVSDTGTGMPPEIRARVFEPFFTTKGEGAGTGIGLSTVVRIAKNHGGCLRVESEPGQGTTFEILLPRDPDELVVAAGPERRPTPEGAGELVVVADGERSIRDLVSDGLRAHGYRVLAVSDGPSAMKLMKNNVGDVRLVIVDAGLSVYPELRSAFPDLPVVVTGTEVPPSSSELADGMARVLKKPFVLDQILVAVGSSLGKK